MRILPPLLLVCATLFASPLWARQDPTPVKKAIDEYLRIQTRSLPGQVSFTVGNFEANNNLVPCTAFEVATAPGARSWGRTSVTVRCLQEGGWTVFVPVHIRVVTDYLVSARSLSAGQLVGEADLGHQQGDLSDLPSGVLTESQQAVGKTAAMAIPAGRPLRADMVKQPMVVQQGQSVKVVSQGPGFQVANEGRALNNAIQGQVVQVRLGNGQVVSGIAQADGHVTINY